MGQQETKLLWIDPEHLWVWESSIEMLREDGFEVSTLTAIDREKLVEQCKDMDGMILHCGTITPIAGLVGILSQIKETYPKLRLILETNAKHPAVEHLVDDYITKPIRPTILSLQLSNLFMLDD